jgi:hypothetical protein
MICIILVAGHGVLLEEEISLQQDAGSYSHLVGVPKALLPASSDKYGDTILDCWWKALKRSPQEHVCSLLLTESTCQSYDDSVDSTASG